MVNIVGDVAVHLVSDGAVFLHDGEDSLLQACDAASFKVGGCIRC